MKFVPDNWKPRPEDITWAIEKFGITQQEADRQLELMRLNEYKRHYTCWWRAYRRWMINAAKWGQLEFEHKPRLVEEVSEEQLEKDREDFKQDLKRLKVVKCK